MDDLTLQDLIRIINQLPDSVLLKLSSIPNNCNSFESLIRSIQSEFGSSNAIKQLLRFIENTQIEPNDLSIILRTVQAQKKQEGLSSLSLVWSGPNLTGVPMRLTAQVIKEMINDAKESLFISSFSFYKIKEIIQLIDLAVDRGVHVSLLLETPQSSNYKVKTDPLKLIDKALLKKITVFIWPYKNRKKEGDKQTGSLHAKFIIQDNTKLFISSANLTQSAMDRNIELGVIIEDKETVNKVLSQIQSLMSQNIITSIKN